MKSTVKIWESGNSLVIAIPRIIVKNLDLKKGDPIEIDIKHTRD